MPIKIIRVLKSIILNRYRKYLLKYEWRKRNKHNHTEISSYIYDKRIFKNINVGNYSYGKLNIMSYNPYVERLQIGNFVSIADNVYFILSGNHNVNCFSTYPFKVNYLKSQKYEATSKGPVIIEDDVWIGFGSIILSGVTIKKGAIIAAGSVVTKNVEEFSIYAGNPARKIKDRYNDDRVKQFMKSVDFSKINNQFVENNIEFLYEVLTIEKTKKIGNELVKINAISIDTLKQLYEI